MAPTIAQYFPNCYAFVEAMAPIIFPLVFQHANQTVRTMCEMWDAEPDGRITSGCARDRLARIHAALSEADAAANVV
jgi:hypothetical protein